MNITFIAESYYPSMGGVENVTKYLAEGLAKKNNNVTIITTKNDYADYEEINGVCIKRFDLKKNKFKKYYGEIDEYINYILNRNDDYVIFECSETITTNLLLPYLKQIKGKKILHVHGCYGLKLKPFNFSNNLIKAIGNFYNYIYWNAYYYPYFLSKYINDFDATISLSSIDSSKEYFDKYYKGKRYILGNAAENIFFENKKETNLNYDFKTKKYFLSVANYNIIKNQIGILKQFKKSESKKNYDLVFIGSKKNTYCKKLLKIKEKMKLYNVYILYGLSRENIVDIMKNSFIYLIGSSLEEFSISLIEAMASGIPFISTNVGNAKLLPGGIVLKNLNEMQKKMDYLVENSDLYLKLSNDAKKYAYDNCTIEKCVQTLIEILNEI